MAKKRGSFNFGADPAEVDAATYGELSGLDWSKINSDKLTIEAISIEMIQPDFRQPRRTMPTAVRKLWRSSNLADMMQLFGAWLRIAKEETEETFPLEKLLEAEGEGQDGSELEAEHFPVYYNLMQTTQLAASIKRDKLKNPITVYRVGDTYKIETGERRWLAFHLLEYFYGDGRWEKIAAKVGEYDVWGQATENNQRSSLNAIGKARQFALLLMQLYPDVEWKAYEECETDQAFYAQVADGDQWRIPRGKGGQLMNAMGEQNPSRLREYRSLLRLDLRTWEKADDGNWKLTTVLNFIRPPSYTVQNWTVSDDESSSTQDEAKANGGDSGAAGGPGEQRAQAAGLYPMGDRPEYPSNRGVPQTQPRFKVGDYVLARGLQDRISRVRNWNAKDGQWYYEVVLKAGRYAENELVLAEAPAKPTAQNIPTPAPSTLSGEGNQTPDIEEEDDPYDGRDWERPVKSTDPLFDKDTLMLIRDFTRLTKDEVWRWVTTHGYGLPNFMTWHSKVEEAVAEALALAEDTAIEFDTEHKTKKREVSE